MDFNKHMDFVNSLAEKGLKKGELPIAAALILDDKIITSSFSSERQSKQRLVHAELLALLEADKILTSKERKRSILITNLEPCMLCLGAAITFGVEIIVYSLESPYDGAIKLLDKFFQNDEIISYSRPKIIAGIFRDNTLELFKTYLKITPQNSYRSWVEGVLTSLEKNSL